MTGTNGKTIVTRIVADMVRRAGKTVGLVCTEGIFAGDRTIEGGDCSGPRSARKVLLNPQVEAAVFEAGRGGILREGLGFDRCEVAVVTNIAEGDHLGSAYIDTPEQMFTVKRSPVDVVLPTGTAVLKADEPLVAEMGTLSAGATTFFAIDGEHAVIKEHRIAGKRVVFVREGAVIAAEGANETPVLKLAEIPMTYGGRVSFQVENVLATVGAAWAQQIDWSIIRETLRQFRCDSHDCPGRFNVFSVRGATVIVDDAHNIPALRELCRAIDQFPNSRRTIVYSAGDGRRDVDIIRQGEMLGEAFDRVVLYEDYSASDRRSGELISLFRQGLANARRTTEIIDEPQHRLAIESAFARLSEGELLVIQPEDQDVFPTLKLIQTFIGVNSAAAGGRVQEVATR